ncbi:MAG: response regulator transcription factor [Paludibaculum sp.]
MSRSVVFVFTEQPVLAHGLQSILSPHPLLEFAGSLDCVDILPDTLERLNPDIVVVDWSPNLSWQRLASLCGASLTRKVVLMARNIAPELAFQAREAGVAAVIDTHCGPSTLTDALQRVAIGQCVFDSSVDEDLRVSRAIRLTPREGQLITLLSQGLKNKEIATCLGISEGTVKVYLSKLFQKVGAKDRFELALFGLKNLTSAEVGFDQETPRKPPNTHPDEGTRGLRSLIVRPAAAPGAPNYQVHLAGR